MNQVAQLDKLGIDALRRLQPIAALSDQRLSELAELCFVERVSKNLDPFRVKAATGQMVFLLRGELALSLRDGSSQVMVGGSAEATHPLGRMQDFNTAKTITDVDLLRIDDDLLDILATWDQIASAVPASAIDSPSLSNWAIITGMFSIQNLRAGVFAQLPPAHISELFGRFERVQAVHGEVIVREGGEGDYYYLIESGKAVVDRTVGGVSMQLAQLKAGEAFG